MKKRMRTAGAFVVLCVGLSVAPAMASSVMSNEDSMSQGSQQASLFDDSVPRRASKEKGAVNAYSHENAYVGNGGEHAGNSNNDHGNNGHHGQVGAQGNNGQGGHGHSDSSSVPIPGAAVLLGSGLLGLLGVGRGKKDNVDLG